MPDDDLIYPQRGLTKGDLRTYYEAVAQALIRHAAGRPLSMQRVRDDVVFYQQRAPKRRPAAVHVVRTATQSVGPIDHLTCDNLTTVRLLANLRCVGVHCWSSRRNHLERPDWMVFDLDPPKADGDGFAKAKHTAVVLRERLEDAGLRPFLKTSGSTGLHVIVPIQPELKFDSVRAVARRFAEDVTATHPDLTTLAQRKAKRGNRVFLDVLRNAWGQTVVAAYSPRMRPEASVSTPIAWSELDSLPSSRAFDLTSVPKRLREAGDPWSGMARRRRSLRSLGLAPRSAANH